MNKTQLMNNAARWSKLGTIDAATRAIYEVDYKLIKDELLSRKPWIFTLDIIKGSSLTEADAPVDLGYNKTYILPAGTLAVEDTSINNIDVIGVDAGMAIGLAIDPGTVTAGRDEKDFIFSDGYLHINALPEELVIRKEVDEVDMPQAFVQLLVFKFGEYLAAAVKQDNERAMYLRRKASEQFIVASSDLRMGPPNVKATRLREWIRKFYQGISY